MGKSNDCPNEGWSKAGETWLNSLSFEDATDLFWMMDHGPDNEKDEHTLERLLDGYAEATGCEREPIQDDADGEVETDRG